MYMCSKENPPSALGSGGRGQGRERGRGRGQRRDQGRERGAWLGGRGQGRGAPGRRKRGRGPGPGGGGMAGAGWAPPRLDEFILTERLGTGTYATVYKAYRKVVSPSWSPPTHGTPPPPPFTALHIGYRPYSTL